MLASVSSFQTTPYGVHNSGASNANELIKKDDKENHENKNSIQSEQSKLTQKAFEELSKHDQEKVEQLKKRDLEVKAHERAHLSAAGSFATGGASYTYTSGPDGVRYATGGEVGIDLSKIEGDPAATIRKADAIRRASLAPVSPSSQDQLVSRKATALADSARIELIELDQEEQNQSKKAEETKQSKGIEKTAGAKKGTGPERAEESEAENKEFAYSGSILPKGSLLDLVI